MLFSSVTFLFWFLPIVLALYFLAVALRGPIRLQNHILLAASLLFYAWGEPVFAALMLLQCLSCWGFGLLIGRYRGTPKAKAALVGALAVGLGGLGYFKYAGFFTGNLHALFPDLVPVLNVALPIGISFYTFQALSYVIDVYRGTAEVQRSFLTFATYVALFPQLIAGPIVRYVDVAKELTARRVTLERFSGGARRFVLGLGKKVLLANVLGELVAIYKDSGDGTALFAWLYVFAYSFHVYFDFSGYSDMAIGLGHMLGFRFLENFNYPYIAQSITDFWRRWHISLSSWFRDYVYIPLGGSRVKSGRFAFNLLLVWLLTGFWHGAGWSFMAWGVYFGVLLLGEKLLWGKALGRAPRVLRHAYVILIVLVSWTFFDAASFAGGFAVMRNLFAAPGGLVSAEGLYYLRSYAVPLLIAAVGSTPLPKRLAERVKLPTGLEPAAVLATLTLVTAYLVDGSFNPFIYFRF